MNQWKDYSSASSYPRPLSSIIVSVGLLAVFITFGSWVLLSYPIGTAVRSYFYDVNGIGDLSSSNSWQNRTPSFNGNLGLPQLKDGDGVDANRAEGNKGSAAEKPLEVRNDEKTTPGIQWQNATSSEVSIGEKTTPGIQWLNATSGEVKNDDKTTPPGIQWQNTSSSEVNNTENVSLDANREERDNEKVKEKPSEVSNNENTTQVETQLKDAAAVDVNQENKDRQRADGGKINQPLGDNNPHPSGEGECDLFHGEWYYDESGPLYTNNSCPIITQMQNCQGNGRPDKGYESWRWKPSQCVLPRFDAHKFLELMRGKTLAFVGDSVARNQMESLLCILWQVEVPKNRGSRHMQRWFFKSKQVMIVRIWSSWLVHQTGDAFKDVPGGVTKVFLDVPDETFMEHVPKFDVVVLSSGHWFAKQSIYIQNNEIVGTQLWKPPNGQHYPVNNVEAFGISVETAMRALATHPNYKGITILRSYSPDHYEGGAWNTGGSCTGKVEPARPGNLVENGFTNVMHEKQVSGFERGSKKQTNGSKLKLMDITEVFSYRHDGHPGPYRSPDPNKITKRSADGRPPPQDCLHWCMPGPVDTWNEFVLEIFRREYEK